VANPRRAVLKHCGFHVSCGSVFPRMEGDFELLLLGQSQCRGVQAVHSRRAVGSQAEPFFAARNVHAHHLLALRLTLQKCS